MLITILFTNPTLFLIVATAILLALSLHEYFHAWTAYFLGDSTAKNEGRLTINPLAHLDPMGTILILIAGIGWGKPVPINPYNLRNQKWGSALVALAGPASNFSMALIVGLVLRFLPIPNLAIFYFCSFFVWINLVLGFFNLMPIPPLDGSHIFSTIFGLSEKTKIFLAQNSLFMLLGSVFFMMYIGIPFILGPLFTLITGLPSLL